MTEQLTRQDRAALLRRHIFEFQELGLTKAQHKSVIRFAEGGRYIQYSDNELLEIWSMHYRHFGE